VQSSLKTLPLLEFHYIQPGLLPFFNKPGDEISTHACADFTYVLTLIFYRELTS